MNAQNAAIVNSVAVTGGEQPGTYWIESAPSHRLIKFGPANAPIEFVRAR